VSKKTAAHTNLESGAEITAVEMNLKEELKFFKKTGPNPTEHAFANFTHICKMFAKKFLPKYLYIS
jgi:hypothetical protein